MIKPSQVFTLDEIGAIGEIFAVNLGVKPRIVHFGSHLFFSRSGIKLILQVDEDQDGSYTLEIKYFELPAWIRNQGLGGSFFKEFLQQPFIRDRFDLIRLMPLSKGAERFWERAGFAHTNNYLFMHYQKVVQKPI